jgi:hypothetical protein
MPIKYNCENRHAWRKMFANRSKHLHAMCRFRYVVGVQEGAPATKRKRGGENLSIIILRGLREQFPPLSLICWGKVVARKTAGEGALKA